MPLTTNVSNFFELAENNSPSRAETEGTRKETSKKELEIESEGKGEDEGDRTETLGFVKLWLHMISLTHTCTHTHTKECNWKTLYAESIFTEKVMLHRFLHRVFKISEVKR